MNILNRLTEDRADAAVRTRCRGRGCAARYYRDDPGGTLNVLALNGSSHCTGVKGQCGCLHAEARAVLHIMANGSVSARSLDLLVTMSPCSQCANLIAESNLFRRVFFLEEYDTDPAGIWILRAQGIECRRPGAGETL